MTDNLGLVVDDAFDSCYLEPSSTNDKAVAGSHDSGIGSVVGHRELNTGFISSPQSEMETSFSDEQKLSSTKTYMSPLPKIMMNDSQSTSDLDLSLPPPPAQLWLPAMPQSQPHSADGTIGYPWTASYPYVHPSMLHQSMNPSMQSLPQSMSGGITAEEQQILLKFRQEKLAKGQRESVSSPDGDGVNVYEEVPTYLYRLPNNNRTRQSPDGRLPPHLPPISSLPSSSMASGLDDMDEKVAFDNTDSRTRKENPLYEMNESGGDNTTNARGSGGRQMDNKLYPESGEHRPQTLHKCYCIVLVLVTVLSAASLTISILTSMGIVNMAVNPTMSSGDDRPTVAAITDNGSELETNINLVKLQENITQLQVLANEQNGLISRLNTKVSELEMEKTNLEEQLNKTNSVVLRSSADSSFQFSSLNASLLRVGEGLDTINADLDSVNLTLTGAVRNVSKQPGPAGANGTRGPPGLLDPSLCDYHVIATQSDRSYSGDDFANTALQNNTAQSTIIGASCSAYRFQYTRLRGVGGSYSCSCGEGAEGPKICELNYWRCTLPNP